LSHTSREEFGTDKSFRGELRKAEGDRVTNTKEKLRPVIWTREGLIREEGLEEEKGHSLLHLWGSYIPGVRIRGEIAV